MQWANQNKNTIPYIMSTSSSFQTIVLSGGGAKGPYGLGVLLGLERFNSVRNPNITTIYCGTSVGALNATLAAQGDLPKLRKLYEKLQTKDILGVNNPKVSKTGIFFSGGRRPYYYFKNNSLKSTIESYANYSKLSNAHLLICATNFTTGDLETFYISSLVDEFLEQDCFRGTLERHPSNFFRTLSRYRRIESQEMLVQALLASTAIPFYLPPVKIEKALYIDGGIGNNTPLRQAAYINRFISSKGYVKRHPTYCIINDPRKFKIDSAELNGLPGIIRRTMDIFHNELMRDSQISWERINSQVVESKACESIISSYIDGLGRLSQEERTELKQKISRALSTSDGAMPASQLTLNVIQPSTPLVEDILKFDPKDAKRLKEHGIADCLHYLCHNKDIGLDTCQQWIQELE